MTRRTTISTVQTTPEIKAKFQQVIKKLAFSSMAHFFTHSMETLLCQIDLGEPLEWPLRFETKKLPPPNGNGPFSVGENFPAPQPVAKGRFREFTEFERDEISAGLLKQAKNRLVDEHAENRDLALGLLQLAKEADSNSDEDG